MKLNKKIFFTILLFAIIVSITSVSGADVNVTDANTTSQIQTWINDANNGDTINFSPGTYNNTYLTVNKGINIYGNGATLVGTGNNNVFDISSSNGLVLSGFNINVNTYSKNGISGSNVQNCLIENNVIEHGGDGINIFQTYSNLTIRNNTINDMRTSYGDGISLVNHNTNIDMNSWAPSTIENNRITGVVYGIFIGGNFKGDITGNDIIGASNAAIEIKGKRLATNGKFYGNITNNILNGSVGINMFAPHILRMVIEDNTIIGTSNTPNLSIVTDSNFNVDPNGILIVSCNVFYKNVSNVFYGNCTSWSNNVIYP